MGLSAFYGPVPSDEERFKVLDAAFDAGCRTWDSADVYGDSEELVGKWFKRTGKRDQVFLATKFGITPSGPNNDPVYMRTRVENSLKRLGIPTIDLYYMHRADRNIPIEKTVSAMAELVKEGKVRYIGLSEVTGATLRRAHAIHPIAAVQVEYSPFCLDIEDENIGLKKACEELGITIVAYAPLGRGLLTGAYKSNADFSEDDFRKRVPRFSNDNFPRILSLVGCLKQIGEKYNATSGQISLAWIMAQGPNIIPIPGTKKIEYLKENLKSVNVKLTPAEVAEIRAAADKAEFRVTEMFPPSFLSGLLVDTVPLE
ncbi:NADP-dependent oxidoreductase domain-containing protein [Gymnopilus junonius]|uniref:NADP-dependent oxidoreductase domain-containing protein n=1 Tax=Gymnopilus junonius TaxID=109634 RepID=A0A9P5TH58_GYMJU|nr:NADP-dependent oxidoreductase domain-containing protein [Gymnopilus junonius]